ncbi:MAG: hypothetical protein QXU93_11650 [Thermoproteus sp.]
MYTQQMRLSPVGEYLRLVIMRRLSQGPATVRELDELARRAVEGLGVKYDWRVWPRLLAREVAIMDGTAQLTEEGKWLYEQTKDVVAHYVERTLKLKPL